MLNNTQSSASNVVAIPAKSVKPSLVAQAITRSEVSLAKYIAAINTLDTKLSDFTKDYAKVFIAMFNEEQTLLKKAKTPDDVRAVKQARYDNEAQFKKDTKEKLSAITSIKPASIESAMSRAVRELTGAIPEYKKAASQSEAAAAMKQKREQKPKTKKPSPAKDEAKAKVKTGAAIYRDLGETLAAFFDENQKGMIPAQEKEYIVLQAAFLKNAHVLFSKQYK